MNIKKISICTLVVSSFALLLRLGDLFFFYDSSTGFFSDRSLLSWIAIALTAAFAVGLAIVYNRKKPFLGKVAEKSRSIPGGIFMLLTGLVSLVCAYCMYLHYQELERSGIKEISATGLSLRLPFMVATIVFGVYMLFGSFALISRKNYLKKLKPLSLIAPLWALIYSLYVFVHYSISSIFTENVYAVFSAIIPALFLMNQAKFISDVNEDGRALPKMLVYGSVSSALLIPYSLSAVIYELLGYSYKNMLPLWIHGILLLLGLFIFVFCANLKFEKLEPPEENNSGGKRFLKASK